MKYRSTLEATHMRKLTLLHWRAVHPHPFVSPRWAVLNEAPRWTRYRPQVRHRWLRTISRHCLGRKAHLLANGVERIEPPCCDSFAERSGAWRTPVRWPLENPTHCSVTVPWWAMMHTKWEDDEDRISRIRPIPKPDWWNTLSEAMTETESIELG